VHNVKYWWNKAHNKLLFMQIRMQTSISKGAHAPYSFCSVLVDVSRDSYEGSLLREELKRTEENSEERYVYAVVSLYQDCV